MTTFGEPVGEGEGEGEGEGVGVGVGEGEDNKILPNEVGEKVKVNLTHLASYARDELN